MNARRIALDSSLFIYYIEEHPQFLPLVEPIFQAIALGHTPAVTSQLSLLEVLVHPLRHGLMDLTERYRSFLLRSRNLTSAPISVRVLERASKLRAGSSLRTPDAIQIATAIEYEADLFITNDERLQKVQDITVAVLKDFQ